MFATCDRHEWTAFVELVGALLYSGAQLLMVVLALIAVLGLGQ